MFLIERFDPAEQLGNVIIRNNLLTNLQVTLIRYILEEPFGDGSLKETFLFPLV